MALATPAREREQELQAQELMNSVAEFGGAREYGILLSLSEKGTKLGREGNKVTKTSRSRI